MSKSSTLANEFIHLPWGRLKIWTAGSGPLVIAIHGLGGSGRYWAALAPLISSQANLVAPDLAGFGGSDKPALRFDRRFHLANLDAVIDRFAPSGRPILVGHSVGGLLAALWAANNPDRIKAMAMVGTPYPNPELVPGPAKWLAQRPPAERGIHGAVPFRVLWPAVSLAVRAGRRYPSEIVRDFGRQSIAARADTMWSLIGDMTIETELEGLKTLPQSVNALILAASDDEHVGSTDVSRWRRLLPHADSRIPSTGGHQVLLRTGFRPIADWIDSILAS